MLAGRGLAFGEAVVPIYHLDKADVIVALDADFLCLGPGGVRMPAISQRGGRCTSTTGRSIGCMPWNAHLPNTGAVADHRLRVRPRRVEEFARAFGAQADLLPFVSSRLCLSNTREMGRRDCQGPPGSSGGEPGYRRGWPAAGRACAGTHDEWASG